ncbi:MAG: androgen-induced gene 1 family protein [Rhodobacteraceae bacterium]|nr:androgen-induced gene 1 family protein [Paracoccaceae bacterium]
MNPFATPVIAYRWLVFGAAAFYSVYMIVMSSYDQAGGPFRFLTIWALLLSFLCASRVLAFSERRSTRRWDELIAATAVINFMVVYLFWSLYFGDPDSVTRDGNLGVWWREYYLHAVGPLLMWIDALFINRPFRRFLPALVLLVGIAVTYFLWAELIVSPLATKPVGSVTTGLPYPFLNNMELPDRIQFYAVNAGLAAVLLVVFFALGWLTKMLFGDRY